MSKSLRCSVELDIHSIHSAGTWLKDRESLFLSVQLFGQVRQTRLVGGVFPLFFRDALKFDKVFFSAYDPAHVADKLLDETVRIELLQLSELFRDGRVLAWYEASAKSFLFPSPFSSPSSMFPMREVTMERSVSFPGLRPRLEFSSRTTIRESSMLSASLDLNDGTYNSMRYRRSRSHTRNNALGDRPPFVVRKIEDDLIGRKPMPLSSLRSRSLKQRSLSRLHRSNSLSPKRTRKYNYSDNEDEDDYNYNNNFNNSYNNYNNNDYYNNDNTLALRSSIAGDVDRYEARLERIKARIDNALETDRRLELHRSLASPVTVCKCNWKHHRPCYCCLDYQRELDDARRRRFLYSL